MRTLGAPAPVVLVGGLRDVDAFADGVRGLQRHRAATTTADDAAPLDHHQSAVGDGATPGRHPREADAEVDESRAAIGYDPVTPVEVGVGRFVDWYREYYGV